MIRLAEACERIAATTKKLEKTAIVAEYLKSRSLEEAAVSAVFLSGRPFPVWEETTLQVGGSLLWRIVAELSGKAKPNSLPLTVSMETWARWRTTVLADRHDAGFGVLADANASISRDRGARGPAAKGALVRELLSQVTPLEAKYIVKIMTGDLRIGLKESLVEEAIAKAYGGNAGAKFSGRTCCWATLARR